MYLEHHELACIHTPTFKTKIHTLSITASVFSNIPLKMIPGVSYSHSLFHVAPTLTDFKVLKGQFWSRIIQQNFSIEREQHSALVQIHHAADHVARLPRTSKVLITLVPALDLRGGGGVSRRKITGSTAALKKTTDINISIYYSSTLKPSKTKAWSSDPSSWSGRHPGLAHPTLICPAVST